MKAYADRSAKNIPAFTENVPGKTWVNGFLLRHRELSQRLSQTNKESRAKINYAVINNYFDNIETNLLGVPHEAIVN